jgi:arsenical pump membrane protein
MFRRLDGEALGDRSYRDRRALEVGGSRGGPQSTETSNYPVTSAADPDGRSDGRRGEDWVVASVVLLALGVVGAIARPRDTPAWVAPSIAAVVALVLGTVAHPDTLLRPLAAPIAFLVLAVPFAALLDRLGFFAAAAQLAGRGRHLALGLWILAALVTTILNLDAAVVLLTPLYVRIARRCGLDPLALGFQPVLLACLASSALPVSNLTNLIAASARHLDAGAFVAHLGVLSLVATTVGWFAYQAVLRPGVPSVPEVGEADRRPLLVGGAVVAAVLVGFVVGPSVGVPGWVVALAADVALIALTRHIPIGDIPLGTALVAASLGLLAGSAAAHLHLDRLLAGGSNLDLLRVTAVSALGANIANNLPALLVALPHTGTGIWALLLGVNVGPLVLVTGTLAALLWQASLSRLDIDLTAAQFARVGVRVLLPSLSAAFIALIALRPVVGG